MSLRIPQIFSACVAALAAVLNVTVPAHAQAVAARPASPAAASFDEAWTRDFPPFRIIGNVYWVGSYDLSTYLITTPAGHILVNTGIGDTAQKIKAGIEQLGFRLSDVKMLLATHGHFDHVAGLAELKRMTGAQLVINERDKPLIESGGRTDFVFGDRAAFHFPPAMVDRTFKDGDTLTVGDVTLTAHLHAGHTKGASSFTFDVPENGRTYRVIIANMGSINPGVKVAGMKGYPDITTDYANTFMAQQKLKVDIFLASHASQFRMHEKYKPGDAYDPNRFVDPDLFLSSVRALERVYLDQLAKERASQPR